MKNRLVILSLLTLVVFSFGSCVSPSILQTAKPVEKGFVETSISLSGFANTEIISGAFEANVRTGINDVSDFGFSFGLPIGHYKLDYKHLLYKNSLENFYLSSGIGVEAFMPSESDSYVPGITIPLFLSFNDNGKVTPYLVQRFTFSPIGLKAHKYLMQEAPVEQEVLLKNHIINSGGIGLRFTNNNDRRWFIEFSYFLLSEYFYRSDFNSDTQSWKKSTRTGLDNSGFQFNIGCSILKPRRKNRLLFKN